MTIRDAHPLDAESIWRLNCDSLGYSYPLDPSRAQLCRLQERSSDKLLVACEGDKVMGYIHVCEYFSTYMEPMANIMALAVSPEFRKKGAGRTLLKRAEEWAKARDCVGIRLVSGSDREGAHAFYRACGYIMRKEQKNFMKRFEWD